MSEPSLSTLSVPVASAPRIRTPWRVLCSPRDPHDVSEASLPATSPAQTSAMCAQETVGIDEEALSTSNVVVQRAYCWSGSLHLSPDINETRKGRGKDEEGEV